MKIGLRSPLAVHHLIIKVDRGAVSLLPTATSIMLSCLPGASDADWMETEVLSPFDMLDDALVLAVFGCFERPAPLCSVASVSKRFHVLSLEPYLWQPLLSSVLPPPGGRGLMAWPPCQRMGMRAWRERYKQWHTLSALTWTRCAAPQRAEDKPCARFLHRAAAVGGERVYVYGGRGHEGELGDLWVIRADAAVREGIAHWELLQPRSDERPLARLSATLTAVQLSDPTHHGLLMFGGRCQEAFLNDAWLFDTRAAKWTQVSPHIVQPREGAPGAPEGRWAHSAVAYNSSEVVIFGGSAPGRCFNDVHSFHARPREWRLHETAGPKPSARSGHSVCRAGVSMYVFGGNTTRDSFNDTWEYRMDTRTWAQLKTRGTQPSPRVGHSLVQFGDRLMLFGGRKYMDNSFDAAMHCLDLQARRWSAVKAGGDAPSARTGHAALACGGGMLVFGGLGSGENPTYFSDAFVLRLFEVE